MKEYKYVKFSEDTAKINPEMILREYNKQLGEVKPFNWAGIKDKFTSILDTGNYPYEYKALSKKEEQKVLDLLEKLQSTFNYKIYTRPKIEKELKQFKKEFRKYIK